MRLNINGETMQDPNGNLPEKTNEREKALGAVRRSILALPPEKAVDAILKHPYPVTLVQSMAEEDLYMLVHAVGLDDAMEVLGLSSNVQWEYFLDMEIWSRDRADIHAMTEWLDRLLKADPDRFTHWIIHEQKDQFAYYLFRNVEVVVREYEVDPSEIGDGFDTEDDVHYTRMRPYAPEFQQQQHMRDQFLGDLLRRISILDYPMYQALLLESSAAIPSESEEELLRLRNIRLAEKGFLPFEEAVGVYQPLKVPELLKRGRKSGQVVGRAVDSHPLRVDPTQVPEDANLFLRTLSRIQDDLTLQRLQAEFAGLCNQMISADQSVVRDKTALAAVVAKVGNYISIGLEKAGQASDGKDPYLSVNLVQNHFLADIFRVGYGCALEVKWQADRWRRQSWFSRSGLPLTFWGETWLGVLGGLLIKKPLFFDNYATGVLYREFVSLADIDKTARVLEGIMATDDIFAGIGLEVVPTGSDTFLTCHNALLTLWANAWLGIDAHPSRPAALCMEAFRRLFQDMWESTSPPRRIKDSMRENFLDWLARRTGAADYEVAERMGAVLESLFKMVEDELGQVAEKDLDPRFVQVFLLRAE
jgi:hypothetical protein